MNTGRQTHRRRLIDAAILVLLCLATLPAVQAADYASHDYGTANAADAASVPASSPTPATAAPRPTPSAANRPRRGETMATVRARLGAPLSRRAPVGRPPITRWNYPGYHVYFEGDHVIHTVVPSDPEPLHHVERFDTISR